MRPYLGLRRVDAKALRDAGVAVPDTAIDEHGYTHPRLTTLPMGWKPSPGIAQGAREAVLYGAFGKGSMRARALLPVLDPAARWSSTRVPKLDTPEASAPHALVVDDVLLFRMVPRAARRSRRERGGVPLSKLLRRYDEVNLRTKPSKVHDYDVEQDLLGYRLARNVLRSSLARYSELKRAVATLCARGWQEPHEVEATVARFTHAFLLHRFALSVFSAAYVFSQQHGDRRARVWPSVLRELRVALAILPLVRSDLSRPVSPVLIQTDACGTGDAAVYTTSVAHRDLRNECQQPRTRPRDLDGDGECRKWSAEADLAAEFDAPLEPAAWRIAWQRKYPAGSAAATAEINTKELRALADGVRWASRAPRTRRCRLVMQSDNVNTVGWVRKGRSSKPGPLRQCRRLAAMTLAEAIAVEARWVPTDRCMADQPSRGESVPGPCVADADTDSDADSGELLAQLRALTRL